MVTNFVLVIGDDQRHDTIGHMPFTRDFFASGITFNNAFTDTPVCGPARASIYSGRRARNHGVLTNDMGANLDLTTTLAHHLHQEGYETGFFGKWLNNWPFNGDASVSLGWDEWHAFDGHTVTGGGYFDYHLYDNGVRNFYGSTPEMYSTDTLARKAVRFVERSGNDPFCLVFAPKAPHLPATPAPRYAGLPVTLPSRPPSYMEADRRDKPGWVQFLPAPDEVALDKVIRHQIRSLWAVDDAIKSIVEAVRCRGKLADTVFLYTSDNGYLWGEHGLQGKSAPYEECLRIPLLVRRSFNIMPDSSDALALSIDIAPTILDLAGLPPLADADGVSLVPALSGGTLPREDFAIEMWQKQPSDPVPTYRGLRGADFVYVVYEVSGREEYYDLASDPHQMHSRHDDPEYAEKVQAARLRLAAVA